jgi:heterodisulfide reductase subunit A-like polyferredoxin
MCLPVCPTDSIELISFTNKEMESMIDVLAQ